MQVRQGLEEGIRGEVEGYRAQLEGVKAELAPWEKQMKEVQSRIDVAASECDLLMKQHEDAKQRYADAQLSLKAAQETASNKGGQIKEMQAAVDKYRWVGGWVGEQGGRERQQAMVGPCMQSRYGPSWVAQPYATTSPSTPDTRCLPRSVANLVPAGGRQRRRARTRRQLPRRLSSWRGSCGRCGGAWSSAAPTSTARPRRGRWSRRSWRRGSGGRSRAFTAGWVSRGLPALL